MCSVSNDDDKQNYNEYYVSLGLESITLHLATRPRLPGTVRNPKGIKGKEI